MPEPNTLDKSSGKIRAMFGDVAPRYDLLNRLLSGSLDIVWRRRAAASFDQPLPASILDLCCGTGDQAVALGRRLGAKVVASDFCLPMLELAEKKFRALPKPPARLAGDALGLPFASASFGGVTVSFGLRNFADLDAGLQEIRRVLAPGGQARFLEFAMPRSALVRGPYELYIDRFLPLLGRLISPNPDAYRYLPDSVVEFPQRSDLVRRMIGAGFDQAAWEDLSGGTVCLYKGVVK